MNNNDLDKLKLDLSIRAKNGVNFIIAASFIWLIIAVIWTRSFEAYDKSVLTFIVSGIMLPLAFGLGKLIKAEWGIKNNPLNSLGLWLNFAQLFYFPFLIFILIKSPDDFVMTYAIITGAHLFPYAWFYKEKVYAIMAGFMSLEAMALGLTLPQSNIYLIPVAMCLSFIILAVILTLSYRKRNQFSTV